MKHRRRELVLILGLITSGIVVAESSRLLKIESILDRLESKLLQEESDTLMFTDRKQPRDEKNVPILAMPKRVIESHSEELTRLEGLGRELEALEQEAERLAADVLQTKSKLIQQTTIDNFISVEVELDGFEQSSLQNIELKLDGFAIYERNTDHAGMWMPEPRIPLFEGPMTPGQHTLSIAARMAVRRETGIPVNTAVTRHVKEDFLVNIPDGYVRKLWKIRLVAPTAESSQLQALLEDVEPSKT